MVLKVIHFHWTWFATLFYCGLHKNDSNRYYLDTSIIGYVNVFILPEECFVRSAQDLAAWVCLESAAVEANEQSIQTRHPHTTAPSLAGLFNEWQMLYSIYRNTRKNETTGTAQYSRYGWSIGSIHLTGFRREITKYVWNSLWILPKQPNNSCKFRLEQDAVQDISNCA